MHPTFLRIPIWDWIPWVGGMSIPIHAYGVMVALGMLAGIWVTVIRARRAGMSPEVFYDLGFWSMLAGILGARAAYVAAHWAQFPDGSPGYREHPWNVLKIWEGGQVLYGGLILAVLVDLWLIHRRNLPVLKVADVAAPAVALGIAVGRIGCLLNGCCWGRRVGESFPLGIRFPSTAAVYAGDGRSIFGTLESTWPVHPTQVYAILLGVMLYIVLSFWYERRRWDGQILAGMMIGYALIRFAEEHFRADTPRLPRFWGTLSLNSGQYVSVYVVAAGVLCYLLWGAKAKARLQDL
jgi:phosphatidylglycerol:prolipoprotein diacylglycerol transferase